jgi:hypothetical protein
MGVYVHLLYYCSIQPHRDIGEPCWVGIKGGIRVVDAIKGIWDHGSNMQWWKHDWVLSHNRHHVRRVHSNQQPMPNGSSDVQQV